MTPLHCPLTQNHRSDSGCLHLFQHICFICFSTSGSAGGTGTATAAGTGATGATTAIGLFAVICDWNNFIPLTQPLQDGNRHV